MGMHIGLIAGYGAAAVEGQLAVGEDDQDIAQVITALPSTIAQGRHLASQLLIGVNYEFESLVLSERRKHPAQYSTRHLPSAL